MINSFVSLNVQYRVFKWNTLYMYLINVSYGQDNNVGHPNSCRNDKTQWFAPLYCRFEKLIVHGQLNKYKKVLSSNLFKLQPQNSGKAAYAHGQVAQQWQWRRCAHRACCSLCSGQTARKSSSTCGSAFSLGAAELETSWWLDSYLVPATDTWWG